MTVSPSTSAGICPKRFRRRYSSDLCARGEIDFDGFVLDAEQMQKEPCVMRVAGQRMMVELHGGFLWVSAGTLGVCDPL